MKSPKEQNNLTPAFRAEVIAALRAEMKRKKITQRELAQKLGVGFQSVSNVLSGRFNFSLDIAEDYARIIGISLHILTKDVE